MSTADSLSASGRSSEKLSLPSLQSKMKMDPEASGICADPATAKHLNDRATFLAHVIPFYPKQLAEFLKSSARTLPSGLRYHDTQALILLINRRAYPTPLLQ
ncbi:hypothetical protein H0E87_018542, partial [Populus deltoides]